MCWRLSRGLAGTEPGVGLLSTWCRTNSVNASSQRSRPDSLRTPCHPPLGTRLRSRYWPERAGCLFVMSPSCRTGAWPLEPQRTMGIHRSGSPLTASHRSDDEDDPRSACTAVLKQPCQVPRASGPSVVWRSRLSGEAIAGAKSLPPVVTLSMVPAAVGAKLRDTQRGLGLKFEDRSRRSAIRAVCTCDAATCSRACVSFMRMCRAS